MIYQRTLLLLACAFCLAVFTCDAQLTNEVVKPITMNPPKKLAQLGDPAPASTIMEWVKGKPVKIQPGTNVYVVVFCTLSHAGEFALTNLSDLQRRYQDKGVVVVAISAEPPQTLKDFVKLHGEDIDFTVAVDQVPGVTARAYAIAFNQYFATEAYVVGRDGRVLWFGHPLTDGIDQTLDKIVAGKYSIRETWMNIRTREQMKEYLALARNQDPLAAKAGKLLLTFRTNNAVALCDLAFQIATTPYIENRDVTLATAALDRAAQISTTNTTDIAVDRALLLFQTGQEEAGLAQATQALVGAKTDEDKSLVATTIHAMQVRIAAEKAQPPGQTQLPANPATPINK